MKLPVQSALAWLVCASWLCVSGRASADYTGLAGSSSEKSPFHDSLFFIDQSATTTTLGVGKSYQSRDPLYEVWFSLKARYYFYEDDKNSLNLRLWANVIDELTSSDTTTNEHEPVTGPTWLWGQYERKLFSRHGDDTVVTIGPRFTIPTDKQSRLGGQILGVGAIAGLSQSIALDNVDASRGGTLLEFYLRPSYFFNRTTSLANSDLHQLRQDAGGRPVVTDVLNGTMAVHESLDVILASTTAINRDWTFTLEYVLLDYWAYRPPNSQICILTGCVTPTGQPDATRFRVQTWLVTQLDYAFIPEMSVTLGYYNLTNQIGPDGQRRNPLWSPDARFNLTLNAKLDKIYETLAKKDRN
ncbi:MAG TPA: hypothetical protein VGI10_19385 [Polyangiaceae bacterium]